MADLFAKTKYAFTLLTINEYVEKLVEMQINKIISTRRYGFDGEGKRVEFRVNMVAYVAILFDGLMTELFRKGGDDSVWAITACNPEALSDKCTVVEKMRAAAFLSKEGVL